jgi:hypothetical protein
MFEYDDAAAWAEMRASGAARFHQLEHEASAMLDRADLTAEERRAHELVRMLARVVARVMETNDPVLPRMLRRAAEDEPRTKRGQT